MRATEMCGTIKISKTKNNKKFSLRFILKENFYILMIAIKLYNVKENRKSFV